MGGIFGGSKPAPPPPPPPAPTVDNSAKELAAAQEAERLKRASAGRASTVLTNPLGTSDEPDTATKRLLGA